jgi:hypothetical protein
MNATLQNFCSRLASLGFSVFAQDKVPAKDGWITVHPNGKEHKGQHVEIDDETGGVKKGFGGKFKGQKISEIRSKFRGPQVNRLSERPDRKPEPSPMRTPAAQTSAGQKLGGRLQDVLQKRQQEMEKGQTTSQPTPVVLTAEQVREKLSKMSPEDLERIKYESLDVVDKFKDAESGVSETDAKNAYLNLHTIQYKGLSSKEVGWLADRDFDRIKKKRQEDIESRNVIQSFIDKYKGKYGEEIASRQKEIEKELDDYKSGKNDLTDAEAKKLIYEKMSIQYGNTSDVKHIKSGSDYEYNSTKRERERRAGAAERKANKNPQTVAGVSRGIPMTLAEADGRSVNPDYSKGGNYAINCQTCTFAYELRCRGYNVEAKPRGSVASGGSGEAGDGLGNNLGTAGFIDIETGLPPKGTSVRCKNTRDKTACIKMLDDLDAKVMEPGARYAFYCKWKGKRSAHIFNMAKDMAGQIYLIDSQIGEFVIGKENIHEKYFHRRCEMEHMQIFRIDNTQITQEYQDALKRASA